MRRPLLASLIITATLAALSHAATSWIMNPHTGKLDATTTGAQACVDVFDGAQGIQGPAGPANALTIGTVTTGDPGSSAFANISGTAPNQVLSLTIPRGDQGPPGIGTRADVTNLLDDPSDTMVSLQPASNGVPIALTGYRDYQGNVLIYLDSLGSQYFKAAGVNRIKLTNDGTLTTYRGDGSTLAFRTYSGGQWRGREGVPGSNGQCLAGNTDGSKYWTTCGSGGSGTPGGSDKQVQWNNGGSFAGFGRYSANAQALIVKQLVIQ